MAFEFLPTDLLAFIDETGHHSLSDPSHAVFGVGGCAIPFPHYADVLEGPWRALKHEYFSDATDALHASQISPTGAGVQAIASLFLTTPFYRLAALIDNQVASDEHPYDRCGTLLLAFLHQLAAKTACSRIVLTFESLGSEDSIATRYFNQRARFSDSRIDYVPVTVFRARKQDQLPGLEIADFVMHAAGGQVRRSLSVDHQRKDFRAVFSDVPDEWVYFGHLSDGENDAPRLPVL